MKSMKVKLNISFILIALLMGILGCTQVVAATKIITNRCWIDSPLDGSTTDKDTPCVIITHSDSPSGVSQTEFSINDKVLATISNNGSSLVVSQQTWQPSESGQFTVKARCRDKTGTWGDYATIKITVTEKISPPKIIRPIIPIIPITPLPSPTGPSFSEMTISTDHFYYRGAGCGPKQLTIRVNISDQSGIDSAALFFRLADKNSQRKTDWSLLPMTRTAGEAYSRMINAETDIPGFASFSNSWFEFYFEAKNKSGVKQESEIYTGKVTLSVCSSSFIRQ